MTKEQIDRIVRKSKPTGREVGLLHLERLFSELRQLREGKSISAIYSDTDMERMVQGLSTEKDIKDYNALLNISSSLYELLLRVEMHAQQAYHGIYAAIAQLNDIKNADLEKRGVDTTPVVMSMSQYQRLLEDAKRRRSDLKASYGMVLVSCLQNFLLFDEETVKKASMDVFGALEDAKHTPVADSYVMGDYVKTHCAYSVLPDGTQSNLVSEEAWKDAYIAEYKKTRTIPPYQGIEDAMREERLEMQRKQYELFYKGGSCIRQYIEERTGTTLPFDDKTLEDALDSILAEDDTPMDAKVGEAKDALLRYWQQVPVETRYFNPPEDLTLFDLLPSYVERFTRCPSDLEQILKHLKTEAARLYDCLLDYLGEYLPEVRGLDAEALCEQGANWGQLSSLGIIGMSEVFTPSDETIVSGILNDDSTKDLSLRYRARHNGIAIMTTPSDQYTEKTLLRQTFYTMTGQRKTRCHSNILFYYEMINTSTKYVFAFNTCLELLAKTYRIPDLKDVPRYDTSALERRLEELNDLLTHVYHNVYGNKEEKHEKRMQIRSVFEYLDLDQLRPADKTIRRTGRRITIVSQAPYGYVDLANLERYVIDLIHK